MFIEIGSSVFTSVGRDFLTYSIQVRYLVLAYGNIRFEEYSTLRVLINNAIQCRSVMGRSSAHRTAHVHGYGFSNLNVCQFWNVEIFNSQTFQLSDVSMSKLPNFRISKFRNVDIWNVRYRGK